MTQTLHFADVEVHIRGREGRGFRVELRLEGEQEWAGSLSPEPLEPKGWVPSASETEDGQRLFEWLFEEPDLRSAWSEIRGRYPSRRIRLRIDADEPRLHEVPWEQLREPGGGATSIAVAASDATPLSRYLAVKTRPGSPVYSRPLKVLLAIANPDNLQEKFSLQPVDVDAETELLAKAAEHEHLELQVLPQPCTLAAIEEALKKGCHVLHFVGHGSFSEKKGAVLFLADKDNQVELISETDFAEMIARQLQTEGVDKLRLVFLSSCQTASRSTVDAFRGFAPALVREGVPAVVAMQDLVPVDTAHEFSTAFYDRLLVHGLVDLAANEARSALLTGKLKGPSIPVVFMRLRGGELLGRRGRTSRKAKVFWPDLLDYLEDRQCLPFLGPRMRDGVIASREHLSVQFAKQYDYPLAAHRAADLPRVAQYGMVTADPALVRKRYLNLLKWSMFGQLGLELSKEEKAKYKRLGLRETAEQIGWSKKILEAREYETHHLLAEFGLPLYLTTNFDPLMSLALNAQEGVEARQLGPSWTPPARAHDLEPMHATSEKPVVFHLCGFAGDREQEKHLVLSEDEHLAHLVRLGTLAEQDAALPPDLKTSLSESSYLFLGYQLDDWEFRLLLHGLLKPIHDAREKKVNVGVQLEPEKVAHSEAALDYLRDYLKRFEIDIYWGSTRQFVNELHKRYHGWEPDDEAE